MEAFRSPLLSLLQALVSIDSVNPWLVPGGAGEAQIADFIANWLAPLDVPVWQENVINGRSNLIARLPGAGKGKSLCLYAHLDTVGASLWQERAFQLRQSGDRLYGLGAADDKGQCAAAMLAFKALVESEKRPGGDVWLALLVDEEGESRGAFHFVERYHPDAVIVLEPFGLDRIIVSHQGFGWLDIVVNGRPAHGCDPEQGIDAILLMAEVITRLGRLDREQFALHPHPLNGKTVFHTSTITGGTDYATYPANCKLGIEIGTQPGETIDNRLRELEAVFSQVKAAYPQFEAQVQVRLAREPFEARGHEALWSVLFGQLERLNGKPPVAAGLNAWCDAAIFQQAGIPTLMIGASGGNYHAPDEWVSLSQLEALIMALVNTAQAFCA